MQVKATTRLIKFDRMFLCVCVSTCIQTVLTIHFENVESPQNKSIRSKHQSLASRT